MWVRTRVAAEATVIEVEDEGTGLSEEAGAHLFEPFCSSKPSGTGLGRGHGAPRAPARPCGRAYVPSSLRLRITNSLRRFLDQQSSLCCGQMGLRLP